MNLFKWNNIIEYKNNLIKIEIVRAEKTYIADVEIGESIGDTNTIIIRSGELEILSGLDKKLSNSTFSRKINNLEYIIEDGRIVVRLHEKRITFIKKNAQDKGIDSKMLTLNIKSRVINKVVTPLLRSVCIFDEQQSFSFYL